MRELNQCEMELVAGGADLTCGLGEPESFGSDMTSIYEGAVEFTSYVIERVAKAL